MPNEFNNNNELNYQSEFNLVDEILQINDNPAPSEFNHVSETNSYSSGSQSTSSSKSTTTLSLSNITATMTAVLASTAVIVLLFMGGVTNAVAEFSSLTAFGNSFAYDISACVEYTIDSTANVDFSTAETGLYLIVANSSTSLTIPLSTTEDNNSTTPVKVTTVEDGNYIVDYNFVGEISGLALGTIYAVEVVSIADSKTTVLASEEVKTLGGAVTEIYDITYQCNCLIDGTFEFTLNYIDENSFYSGFNYSILTTDYSATEYTQIAMESPNKTQIIDNIISLTGGEYILKIAYLSTAYSDTGDATGQQAVEKEIEITIKI